MIAEIAKVLDALRAGWSAGRAVMDGRSPVLVEDVLAAEGCVCQRPRVVVIHGEGECGHAQYTLITDSAGFEPDVSEVLDVLADEADRRDGVIR